ncbi:MAG TPA: DUF6600 domain-containing protein [Stellaceae bacterium]|nr:DUF6600 domain-containing protein [Stellaceae bacterium]
MRRLAKGLFIVAALLVVAAPAYAQQSPPARVGRVSIVEGALAFYGPGDSDWSAAKTNFPVAENGWFATDPDARAELRVGAASISLDKNTQAGFTALNERAAQIALAQGRLDLHLRRLKKGETAEVDIARGAVWLMQPGIYEVDSSSPDQPSRILVFEGSARFVGGGLDMTVKAGDALVLSGTDALTANVERVAPDEFTNWCRSHDYREDRLAAPYHVSPAMTGFEALDSYGQWADAPDYGQVWYPASIADDWAPYREGHWAWVEPWGWNWVDDEPWGFAPFHYGRWARINDRWGWVPGSFVDEPVYAPALVAFVAPAEDYVGADVGPAVGWFPLAPGEVYWPSYTRDRRYIRNVNITNVNVNVINRVSQFATSRPNGAPPPQVVNQRFANRTAATVVPATVISNAAPVAKAAVKIPPQAVQQTRVTMGPPAVVAQPATAARPSGFAATPARRGPAARNSPTVMATVPTAARPAGQPNFAHLAPAPQLARPGAQPAQATTAAPSTGANPPAAHEPRPAEAAIPPLPHAGPPQPPAGQAVVAPTPGRPPAPPDFSHLAPTRTRPGQAGQAAAPAVAAPETQPGAVPPPGTAAREPGHRPGPEPSVGQPPPPPNHAAAPTGPTPNAAEQRRAQQEAIAREQAQQRAAAEAAKQQAQQRGAAEAAARQQAQQRAAQAAAQQQAQQRAAQAAAQQQAQQRAAQAAAQQQAQQRAAQAAAQQQAQQRAAQAAAQQQAQQKAAHQNGSSQPHCGHPNEPACPK